MKAEIVCGQVRTALRAGRGNEQFLADVMVNAAARPRTLIARVVIDDDERRTFGNRAPSRCANGWHFAQRIRSRRLAVIVYAPRTGLPVSQATLDAPAYRWWPQQGARRV